MNRIVFIGREGCDYSRRIYNNLKKISKKILFIKSNINNSKKINKRLKKLKKNEFDYLICFRSFQIIREEVLKKIKFFSINFHPGTPKYRGIGCANFAIFNKEKIYGCTCHLMDKKVDNGKILDVKYFKLKKNIDINIMLKKTYQLMFKQSKEIINFVLRKKKNINILIKKNKKEIWSKKFYNRKQLNDLYKINPNINEANLNVLLRACNHKIFKPYLLQQGKKFFYLKKNKKKVYDYLTLFNKKFYHIKEKNI